MPKRKQPFTNGEIYHVFNRGIDGRRMFLNDRGYERGIKTMYFYRTPHTSMKLSRFLELSFRKQAIYFDSLRHVKSIVLLICYCFMPNHFHFLLKQEVDGAISKFMSNFQNSYTRYFNITNERKGQLFMNQFKAVKIDSEDQLIHVSRYIHLNPYSSGLVKSLSNVPNYAFSSLSGYLKGSSVIEEYLILNRFKNRDDYLRFVLDNADYQKQLKSIEKLLLE